MQSEVIDGGDRVGGFFPGRDLAADVRRSPRLSEDRVGKLLQRAASARILPELNLDSEKPRAGI